MKRNVKTETTPVNKNKSYNKSNLEYTRVQAWLMKDEHLQIKSFVIKSDRQFGDWITEAIREKYAREI